jgi:hypothetical protein
VHPLRPSPPGWPHLRRRDDGRVYTEVEVFDTPERPSSQLAPNPGFPGSGGLDVGSDGDHHLKQRDEEPIHPAPPTEDAEAGREDDGDKETEASAELLARVARTESKRSLGRGETSAVFRSPLRACASRAGGPILPSLGLRRTSPRRVRVVLRWPARRYVACQSTQGRLLWPDGSTRPRTEGQSSWTDNHGPGVDGAPERLWPANPW